MDHVKRDVNQHVTAFPLANAPVVDFRFNTTGMQGLYVRGVNMATPEIMKLGMSEGMLFLGISAVIATAAIIDMNNNDAPATCVNVTFALNAVCNDFSGNNVGPTCCPI